MNIEMIKIAGGRVKIRYEDNADIITLDTDEEPQRELWEAAKDTVHEAERYFANLPGPYIHFEQIDITGNTDRKSRITLAYHTLADDADADNQAHIKLPAIPRAIETEEESEGLVPKFSVRNDYNEALRKLCAEAERFVRGCRAQRGLFTVIDPAAQDAAG